MKMPLESSANWLEGPCAFRLPRSRAVSCCVCEEPFTFLNGGRSCEFCGLLCHKAAGCSRQLWLPGDLFRRRVCYNCDRYRRLSSRLRRGAAFTLYEKSWSRIVTMYVDESTGSLLILDKNTGQRVDTVGFEHFEGVRRGFSLGGRLAISQYDPLRSLSLTVHRGKRDFTSYNLTASSALNCQMWVDGLKAAIYVHERVEEQQLAREWYESKKRTMHATGSRFLHNYLPTQRELSMLRRERGCGKAPLSSLASDDSGVGSVGGSLEDLGLLDSYIDIEVDSSGREVLSRVIPPSALFGKREIDDTPSSLTTHRDPHLTCLTPPLTSSTPSLCTCHAHQMTNAPECRSLAEVNRPFHSANNSPRQPHTRKGCHGSRGCHSNRDHSQGSLQPTIM